MMTQTDMLKLNMFDASDKFSNDALNENWQKIDDSLSLTGSAEGSSIQITDAANNCGLYSLIVEGNSSQNGIPTPDATIEIDSIGDSGRFTITTDNGSEISTTATITSALPLCSAGDVKDELIFNADGTAKIIKRTHKYTIDSNTNMVSFRVLTNCARCSIQLTTPAQNAGYSALCNIFEWDSNYSADIAHFYPNGDYLYVFPPVSELSSQDVAGAKAWLIEKGAYCIYQLATPQEITLTAAETRAMLGLKTFEGLTNVFNSDNAQMSVKYWRNEDVGALLTSISRSTNSRLTALENAIIGG